MTVGIYKISFKSTEKVYIGQSISIESRWNSHKSALASGKGPPKLQDAYNTYGIKSFEVLLECSISELNSLEKEAIEIYDSYNNGFNSIPDARNPIMSGENNPQATEDNKKYMQVLKLLVQKCPTLSKKEISSTAGVSVYVVNHIAQLESHAWLKDVMPAEYSQLEEQKAYGYYRGKQYPKLVSPEGIEYEVTNITKFAKQHGLLQPKLTEVMKGTRNHHRGWISKVWWN